MRAILLANNKYRIGQFTQLNLKESGILNLHDTEEA